MRLLKTFARPRVWAAIATICMLGAWAAAQDYPSRDNGQYGYPAQRDQYGYPTQQNNGQYGHRDRDRDDDAYNNGQYNNGRYGRGNSYAQGNVTLTQQPIVEYADPHSATIMWRTDVATPSVIHFGTDPNNLSETARISRNSTMHRVQMLNRFQPGQTYYFSVDSGNNGTSLTPVLQFQTPQMGQAAIRQQQPTVAGNYNGYSGNGVQYSGGQQTAQNNLPQSDQSVDITNGPVLEMVGDTSAVVAWSTSAASSAVVRYGTDQNNLNQTAQAPWGGTTHRVTINNLQPGTHYFFSVESGQAQGTGTSAGSRTYGFTTVAQGAQPLRNQPPQ